MRIWGTIFFVALAIVSSAVASTQASLEELKARVQNASPSERVNLSLEIAERQVAAADKLFREGKIDEAQNAVRDVVSYAGQAGEAAGQSGHRIKNTEIALRKMAHRLNDIKRNVAFGDQAPLQSAIEALEKIRTDLLSKMFGKNAK
jgi:hypothetical protein